MNGVSKDVVKKKKNFRAGNSIFSVKIERREDEVNLLNYIPTKGFYHF